MSQPMDFLPSGDQDLGTTINAVNWLFTLLAAAAVGARIYGRVHLTHNLGWDDFWICVAIVRSLKNLYVRSIPIADTSMIRFLVSSIQQYPRQASPLELDDTPTIWVSEESRRLPS